MQLPATFSETYHWVYVLQKSINTDYQIGYTTNLPVCKEQLEPDHCNLVYVKQFHNMIDALGYKLFLEQISTKSLIQIIQSKCDVEGKTLFQQLCKCMQEEKLFADPDLSRKKLADYLNTNEVYLANTIREATGEIFTSYISNLRLQYALKLLSNNAEMTLDNVAVDSGYGSYSPFYRAFTKKYGITPSEYRKLSLLKERK